MVAAPVVTGFPVASTVTCAANAVSLPDDQRLVLHEQLGAFAPDRHGLAGQLGLRAVIVTVLVILVAAFLVVFVPMAAGDEERKNEVPHRRCPTASSSSRLSRAT
jgi:hypothetical protein